MNPATEAYGRSTLVPCTLCSGHYHYGAGCLANSLYRNGFRGTMCIGYVPPLPPWAKGAFRDGDDLILQVSPDFVLRLIAWQTGRNLSLEKPRFLLHVLDDLFPDSPGALFFDADVTVHGSWKFFEEWVAQGLALCLDGCYPLVPSAHPWRAGWKQLAAEAGYQQMRDLEYYANSGFVGVPALARKSIECWAILIETFLRRQGELSDSVKFGVRTNAFVGDQDMLNAALMVTDAPLSFIGVEGMDFTAAGYTMSHSVEGTKPWQKGFIREAAMGHPPTLADKSFWRYADQPIRLFSLSQINLRRSVMKLASAAGRFYRRS